MTDDSNLINQDEIEALLAQVRGDAPNPAAPKAAQASSSASQSPADQPDAVGQDEIEALLSSSRGKGAQSVGMEVSQSEIEALLATSSQRPRSASPTSSTSGGSTATSSSRSASNRPAKADDIDFLLRQTEEALASIDQPIDPPLSNLAAFNFEELKGSPPTDDYATLDLLRDVELDLKIELGRTRMFLEDVLRLKRGSVVALDKLAGDPVDIYVNGRLVARGEVLVLNDNFCVRVAELVAGNDLD